MSPFVKKISAAVTKISRTLVTRKFWAQLSLIGFSASLLRKYLAYVKSLTTEISYAEFLNLLKAAPDKIEGLQVSPTDFVFTHEGKKMFSRGKNRDKKEKARTRRGELSPQCPSPTHEFNADWFGLGWVWLGCVGSARVGFGWAG